MGNTRCFGGPVTFTVNPAATESALVTEKCLFEYHFWKPRNFREILVFSLLKTFEKMSN